MDKDALKKQYGIDMWPEHKIEAFREVLLAWYDDHKRDLPWRHTTDPYAIWVSEIMLQQTQVATVIPYYQRFLEKFPTVQALAESSEDELLKIWEGLGYYSRVRNMQVAAKQIMTIFGGTFPHSMKALQSLKGVGPYTAGAIGSICFQLVEPALDGNLMRVLARLFEIDLDVKDPRNRKVFQAVAEYLISPERPGDFNQALMDIGATISTPKNYDPEQSPIKAFDASYLNETWMHYPVVRKKEKAKLHTYVAMVLQDDAGRYLLEKRPQKGLLASMWTYPLIDITKWVSKTEIAKKKESLDQVLQYHRQDLEALLFKRYHLLLTLDTSITATITHVFSHQKWTVGVLTGCLSTDAVMSCIPDQCEWVDGDMFDQYTFPRLQQKLVTAYDEHRLSYS